MRLTSDSCTASGTGRGDDLVATGHGERRRGARSALQALEDAATLPSRGH